MTETQTFVDQWKKAIEDQTTRIESAQEEMATFERKQVEQMVRGAEEMARLFKEGINYNTQISEQWRKMSLEAMRRTTAMMTTPWS
jgi:hypothetical protein